MKNFTFNPYVPRFTPSSQFLKKLSKTPFEADTHEYSFLGIHGMAEELAESKTFTFNPNAPRFIPASQRLNSKTLSSYQRPVPNLPPAERIFWFQIMQQEAADEEYYQTYLKKMTKESRSWK